MAAPELSRVFNKYIIYPDQTFPIGISIAADGRPNYLACGYLLLPGQWDKDPQQRKYYTQGRF
jgi:hypothetical protein